MSLNSFIAILSTSQASFTAPPAATKEVFWVVCDSIANGTNNRTGEAKPNPNGALMEWSGSAFAVVQDTATANDGTQYPAFALKYKELTGNNTYLVESALGGTEAYPNGDNLNWYTSGTMYAPAKATLQAALASEGATLKGVIMILGTNDARGSQTLANIQLGFTSLLNRINTDFNTPAIYMMQLGRNESGFPQKVRDVQNIIAGLPTAYPNVQLVGSLENYVAMGYYGPDNLHLNQAGNNYLGQQLATFIANAAAFDATRVFTQNELYDQDTYYFTGQLAKSPTTNKVVHLFHHGARHTFDANKKVSARISTDGLAFSLLADVANPTEGGVQDVSNWYTANGRLHTIYCTHQSFAVGVSHYLFYQYSDDDGVTWSAKVNLGLPPNGDTTSRALGKGVETNGVLLKPYYSSTDEGNFGTISSRWVLRSTDGGATWNHVLVETSAVYINEGSLLASGNDVLYVARVEAQAGITNAQRFKIYKSSDAGLTWTSQGYTSFGDTWGYAHPAHLEKFKVDNVDVAACYFCNRDTKEYKVIYGRLNEVMAGIAGWNGNTKISFLDFDTFSAISRSGYGAFYHPSNDLFARGMAYIDLNSTANILYFDLPTTHYATLKTQLGI